ncbi:MAG: hypothetical protein LC135_06625 [Phycisphaerae bacterium]|nr:hypothetical protein [Phycisphaerae bacterium]MCZ2399529.1 hypothetical protein [Phycisphaerae bacterium]NUQ50371.1 hypothetical protein [Phycisphaerae bacterium]
MLSQRQDLVLGVVAVGFLALLVGTILFINPLTAPATREIIVEFAHDDGLAPIKKGSRVLLAGALDVGKVTRVELRRDTTSRGELLITVAALVNADLALYRDCHITTTQPPVGGGGVLVIVNVGTLERGLVQREIIRGAPPESLSAAISELSRRILGPGGMVEKLDRLLDDRVEGSLAYKIQASMDDINALTQQVRMQASVHDQAALLYKLQRAFDDVNALTAALRQQSERENSAGMLAKVHGAIDTLSAALGQANALLADNRPPLNAAISDVAQIAATVRNETLPAVNAELDRGDGAALLGKLHGALDQVNGALNDVGVVTDATRRMVLVNRPAVDRTITNVKEASAELRGGIQALILNPWRILNKPSAAEQAKMDAFEAARRFAEAATYLDDASSRLEALVSAAGDGSVLHGDAELDEIRATLKSAFERFRAAEEFLWERMK